MAKADLFIFDMDGVLIESEPFWRQAQIELLQQYNVTITAEDCIHYTMGKRLDDIAATWIEKFTLNVSNADLSAAIMQGVVALITAHGHARDGLSTLLDYLSENQWRLALATSSSYPIIDAVLTALDIKDRFELMLSADDVENGKPAPDVYLEVCRRLNVKPEDAVALEDSFTGVRAAVASGARTIAIPEHPDAKFTIAAHVVNDFAGVVSYLQSL